MIDFVSPDPPNQQQITGALLDFGLYHPLPIAQRMFAEYKNHGHYWYPGAGVDQPDEFWADISIMNWLELYVKHVLPHARNQQQMSHEDVITRLQRGGSLNG